MNLENMLSEINQTQKNKRSVMPLTRDVRDEQIHRDRKLSGGCLGWGRTG